MTEHPKQEQRLDTLLRAFLEDSAEYGDTPVPAGGEEKLTSYAEDLQSMEKYRSNN